jgi:hypothetical protein
VVCDDRLDKVIPFYRWRCFLMKKGILAIDVEEKGLEEIAKMGFKEGMIKEVIDLVE